MERCLAVSNGRLCHALTAQAASGSVPHTDKRGRHVPVNKTSKEKLLFVGEHIENSHAMRVITPGAITLTVVICHRR